MGRSRGEKHSIDGKRLVLYIERFDSAALVIGVKPTKTAGSNLEVGTVAPGEFGHLGM